ncbi:MAG: E2/UBC family protein [Bdellovibrionota bacterium]
MRRDFSLPETDVEFLEASNLKWETVIENNIRRLVIHEQPVPSGYNHSSVSLNFRIEGAYPDTQIDMVYFYPPLERTDKVPIRQLSNDAFDGKVWQRWSRHRTAQNPWISGVDDVAAQLVLVEDWLAREFKPK